MSLDKKAQRYRLRKASKRVLLGETLAEEAARLEHGCEPGVRGPFPSRPGWNSKTFIPLSERIVAEEIAKKMRRKAKTEF